MESAGLAVPADGDPQRERVKAGAKRLASGLTKLLEEFNAGPLNQHTASESVTGSSAATALVRSQARLSKPPFSADSATERCA